MHACSSHLSLSASVATIAKSEREKTIITLCVFYGFPFNLLFVSSICKRFTTSNYTTTTNATCTATTTEYTDTIVTAAPTTTDLLIPLLLLLLLMLLLLLTTYNYTLNILLFLKPFTRSVIHAKHHRAMGNFLSGRLVFLSVTVLD